MIKTFLSDSVVHTQVGSAINYLIKIKIFFLIAIIFNKQEQKLLKTSAPRVNFMFSNQKHKYIR